MSKVDWSLAPDDATHYGQAEYGYSACWYKKVNGRWHGWLEIGDNSWDQTPSIHYDCGREESLIARNKPWSGPEDGLPPVGTVCEYSLGDSNCWYVCEIKYVLRDGDGLVAECHLKPSIEQYLNTYQGTECLATFRAIKTEKQQAADQRESAIRELMDIAQVDCRVTAARLVDAGFKREVV